MDRYHFMMQATKTISYSYLLIGSGRVARHLGHYFNLLNISHETWDRSQDPVAIRGKIAKVSHVLLAISDSAIEGFYRQHLAGLEKTVVHFSGALDISGLICAHPLMTFHSEIYDLETYKKIHFTMTGGTFAQALPGLDNSFSNLEASQKALYHTACVLGGNFTTLLIQKMLTLFNELGVPASAAEVYLQQVLKNTFAQTDTALTGPLARKDIVSVERNLQSLANDPYQQIYQSFLKAHWVNFPQK